MISSKKIKHLSILFIVILIAVFNRLTMPLVKNTPYGMDFYEFISYVFSSKTTSDILRLPHGLIYYLLLFCFKDLGPDFFLKLGAYILPALFSFTILPLYFIGKIISKSEEIGYLSLLIAGSVNILIHQTGATVIPEALALMFAGLSFLYLLKLVEDPDIKNFSLSTTFLLLTSLSHHLTTLIFNLSLLIALLSLMVSSKFSLSVKKQLLAMILATSISITFTMLYWYFFSFNYTLKLILNTTTENFWLILLMLICGILVIYLFPHIIKFLSRPFRLSIKPWAIAFLAFFLFSMAISYLGLGLFLIPVIFYGLPIVFSIIPLSWVGLRSIFNEEKSYIKKSLIFSQIFIPVLISASFLLSRDFAFMSYRTITTSLFFSSPIVAYGVSKAINSSPKKIKFLLTVILTLLFFSLSLTSTPSKEFLCGIEESYSTEELNAARFTINNLNDKLIVNTDVRFGNLLLFFSEGKIKGFVGNRMYFQNISDNLLVQLLRGDTIYFSSSPRVVIVTKSMLKEEGGVVVLPFYMELKSIGFKDVDFLNNYEYAARVFDSQDVIIFIIECQDAIKH